MRQYEIVCIFHPELDETALAAALEKVQGWITEAGGTIDKTDVWGRRKLAYPIQKQTEGQYVLMETTMPPALVSTLESKLRIDQNVMRSLIVVK